MKTFMAVYTGTQAALERSGWNKLDERARKERQQAGIDAWNAWMERHAAAIVYVGGPLGKTKRITREGIADTRNELTGFVVIHAATHEAAAKMFEGHPHFTIFPGEAVEVMECLPVPGA